METRVISICVISSICILLLANSFLIIAPATAASDRSKRLSLPRAGRIDIFKARNYDSNVLNQSTLLLAEKIGIRSKMEELRNMRLTIIQQKKETPLEMLTLKQDLSESILIAGWELRTVLARIDQEVAAANEIYAVLAERRDKAVRYNTYADFISGGISGIVGGGLKLGEIQNLSPDLIDTAEGVVQTALSGWAFKQQTGERQLQQGVPNMLTHLIDHSSNAYLDFPPSVWAFLNLPIELGGTTSVKNDNSPIQATQTTLVAELVDRWIRLNFCLKHSGHKEPVANRRQRITNTNKAGEKLTIDVLEDRIALLTDLKSCIQQMDYSLLELFQFVHGTKSIATATNGI